MSRDHLPGVRQLTVGFAVGIVHGNVPMPLDRNAEQGQRLIESIKSPPAGIYPGEGRPECGFTRSDSYGCTPPLAGRRRLGGRKRDRPKVSDRRLTVHPALRPDRGTPTRRASEGFPRRVKQDQKESGTNFVLSIPDSSHCFLQGRPVCQAIGTAPMRSEDRPAGAAWRLAAQRVRHTPD